MRTLKKTLCLVLALVMVLGLCAVNVAAAEFTDKADIKYTEAVAVMQAAKVLDGMPDGSFNPNGTLTRAQAAKMIACMLGFGELKGAASFTDTKGHWAESYIALCVKQGIVDGYGDGKFGPDDTLTGSQWAKMVIGAIGYDYAAEGITGTDWEIAVAKLVKNEKLAIAIKDFNGTKPISRQEASELAFQGMQKATLTYKPGVEINGVKLPGEYNAAKGDSMLTTLGITKVENTTAAPSAVTAADNDAYGRPAVSYWKNATGKLYTNYQVALAKEDGGDIDWTKAPYKDWVTTSLAVVENGNASTSLDKDDLAGMTGAQIEFYGTKAADGTLTMTKAVVVSYAYYKVTAIAKNGDITLTKGNTTDNVIVKAPASGEKESADYTAVKGFAKDDVLAISVSADSTKVTNKTTILDAVKAATVEGKVTAATTKESAVVDVTVNGTKYVKSSAYLAKDELGLGSKGTLYLDANGKVISFVGKTAEVVTNYLYVVDVYETGEQTAYGVKTNYHVLGLDMSGNEVSYQVFNKAAQDAFKAQKGEVVKVDNDTADGHTGMYVLKTGAGAAASGTDYAKITAEIKATDKRIAANQYFAGDVKFVFVSGGIDADGNKTLKVTVKDGVQAVAAQTPAVGTQGQEGYVAAADITKICMLKAAGDNTNKLINTVFVKTGYTAPLDTSSGIAFVKDVKSTQTEYKKDANGKDTKAFAKTIYVDGVKTDIWYASEAAIDSGTAGFYTVQKNGELTVLTKIETLTANLKLAETVTGVFQNMLSTTSLTDKTIAEGAPVISLVAGKEFTATELAPIAATTTSKGQTGATVSVVLDKDSKTVTTIYVTAAPTETAMLTPQA